MPQLLEPRETPPHAWKRWLKVGLRLSTRMWLTVLPLSLILGLAGGWLALSAWGLGIIALTAVSGLWQAALLHTAEAAAAGKRVDVGTAWEGLARFWRQPGAVARHQLKVRAVVSAVLATVLMLVLVLPLYWALSQQGAPATPTRPVTPWILFVQCAAGWGMVFMWSWMMQRGGSVAMASFLVRQHGVDWETAHRLQERALLRNHHNLRPLSILFLVSVLALFLSPWLVFLAELAWVSVMTVAARDIFGGREALEPQEARSPALALAPR